MQWATGGAWAVEEDDWSDWKLGRERFAHWLTSVFQSTGVTAEADWLGARSLAIEPAATDLLSTIAILLGREVGAEGAWLCDSCGRRVYRARAPREGERVYCSRPECKKEQHRRNTAASRANKRAKEQG